MTMKYSVVPVDLVRELSVSHGKPSGVDNLHVYLRSTEGRGRRQAINPGLFGMF